MSRRVSVGVVAGEPMLRAPGTQAAPPRAPELTRQGKLLQAKHEHRIEQRLEREHRSLLRGALWLLLIILGVSIARAGLGRAFVPGWWNQW